MRIFGRRRGGSSSQEAAAAPPAPEPRPVPIRDDMIRLGQLLKLAGLVEHGGEAREVIAAGRVTVDGEVDTRRGAQIRPGSVIALDDEQVQVVVDDGTFDDGLPW